MAQEHPLQDVFQRALYRVRTPGGGCATIRIGEVLPDALLAVMPDPASGWGFITAWNPRGEMHPREDNRRAQRALREALHASVPQAVLRAGHGSLDDWRESGLFVAGIDAATLDALMLRFDQLAVVCGNGHGPAMLRWSGSEPSPQTATASRMDTRHGLGDNGSNPRMNAMTADTATPVLFEARDLSFLRQDEPVFGPLDVQLSSGDVLLVEGDNGSGKTTLLRVIAGLLHPDSGSMYLEGETLDRDNAHGRLLFLAHHLGLKADLSPLENLRVAIGLYGSREDITPLDALHKVGLQGYEHEPVRQLSAGQKKRAALARLLLLTADVWLLDEPFANLDREGIALVNRLIERHAAEGGAAMVTSHGAVTFLHGEPRRLRMSAC